MAEIVAHVVHDLNVSFIDMYHTANSLQILTSTRRWDAAVAPSLGMNWYRDRSPITLGDEGLMGLTLAAINRGVAYRNTTRRRPVDTTATNATLIYGIVRKNIPNHLQTHFRPPTDGKNNDPSWEWNCGTGKRKRVDS